MEFLLVEPAIVPATFCSGIAEPEDLGDGNMLFTGFAKQRSFIDHGVEYVVVSRIIMPATAVLLSIEMTMKAMGIACCGRERMKHLSH